MRKKFYSSEEFMPLNNELYNEFSIQELELRLETDPLLFVDFFQQSVMASEGFECTAPASLILCTGGATLNQCSQAPEALIA
jgi:hypothetical protein